MKKTWAGSFILSFLLSFVSTARASTDCTGITLRHIGPTSVQTGGILQYKIRIVNNGSCELNSLQLTDYLPRRTLYREGQPHPTEAPGGSTTPSPPGHLPVQKVKWRDIILGSRGDEASFEIHLQVLAPPQTLLTDTACLEHQKIRRICSTLDVWVTH